LAVSPYHAEKTWFSPQLSKYLRGSRRSDGHPVDRTRSNRHV